MLQGDIQAIQEAYKALKVYKAAGQNPWETGSQENLLLMQPDSFHILKDSGKHQERLASENQDSRLWGDESRLDHSWNIRTHVRDTRSFNAERAGVITHPGETHIQTAFKPAVT
jgi:hypothetical protein